MRVSPFEWTRRRTSLQRGLEGPRRHAAAILNPPVMTRFSVAGKRRRARTASDAGPSSAPPVYGTHDLDTSEEEGEEEEEEEKEEEEEEDEGPEEDEHQQQGTAASIGREERPDSIERIAVSIDSDVLDCAICCEPLAPPVYQCGNGHIACSSCCAAMKKCHSCPSSLGPSRCLALEKVLESITVPCPNAKHGCRANIVYYKRQAHSRLCMYSPCACPLSDCTFEGTLQQLKSHFNTQHRGCAMDISYNLFYHISLDRIIKGIQILRAQDGILYVLSGAKVPTIGKSLSLTCIRPDWPNIPVGQQQYELLVKSGGSSLRLLASMASVAKWKGTPSSREFLLVPSDFFSEGNRDLEVCIHSRKR